ncbi:MAG: hypothetical protein GWN99_02645 [Gemmatimonadetes bacterium]|uniref:Mannosylglycerate hydrolase MGH1-like glycoside hydrolase domain-containing protein n=1 Tax=Candidatus Kutchimonas denitrificans TaxID=3056748 RepID=A0AAE4Z7V5_9BACT|nr:hypothetical protein [Gemmatimonadota bacterium]NIR74854.1 hypothetical protein [Candidatus Kutchimonas denitrificans]NIR99965.1 hypothetical protein [Gemmatimonadota bacterium]NIT65549.1 hypothetical protein [Gemmatimonadota bacterium]NIU52519.1 hypothetical protein [Gemmatimonadota bacterium]
MRESLKILFVLPDAGASRETSAARVWLEEQTSFDVRCVPLSDLPQALEGPEAVVWFHWVEPPRLRDSIRLALDAHVRAGGGALATLAAAGLPVALGWEEIGPNDKHEGPWSPDAADEAAESFSQVHRIRGLQSFRGHPLFEGLGSGVYLWSPKAGERFVRWGYADEVWPLRGRVIAVERSYISMNPERRLAWEYMVGDGWALCIGGYVNFGARSSRYRPHLECLISNALYRVAPNGGRARLLGGAWRRPVAGLEPDSAVPLPPELEPGDAFETDEGELALERAASDVEFTLAGARALLAGSERSGPEEVWFHPFRAVSRWRLQGRDRNDVVATWFRIEPGVITRKMTVDGRGLVERTTVAPSQPALLLELAPTDGAVRVAWSTEGDLRPMWPYPPEATGRLSYRLADGAVGVQAETGEWLGLRIDPAPAELRVVDASDSGRSRVRLEAELEISGPVRFLLLASTRAEELPASRAAAAAWRAERLEARRLQREARAGPVKGDPEVAAALEWAKWRLSTYRVTVPGVGTSLVAGYGRSGPGAFGDGRPGYGWYFGRDACWTALACLAVGQADAVREVLEFLGRHQDLTGQIPHECTTSGVVHYDAADSTPLYLLLAARYLLATGDRETLDREWPRIVKAYRFCLTTDSDGDGLIENTGVGHGWIEFGRLGGHHVSLYLAGVWTAALSELETAARSLGHAELAGEIAYRAAAARASLELSFFDPIAGRYAHGRRADGSLNTAETAMTAVPLLLGAVRAERCESWLDRVASDDFTAPWGVRLLPRSDPDYRPDAYHGGSIWPLFTGWVSLAEARAARAESAGRHAEGLAGLYRIHSLGAWPEVLHGDEPRSIGVTADQAWSTALTILALVESGWG